MEESAFLEKNSRVLDLLKSIEQFNLFSDFDLNSFLELGKLRKFEENEMVLTEGEFDSWIYFLLTGEVEIIKDKKVVKRFRRSGDIFGEMGVLDGSPRCASIRTTQKTLLLGVDGSLLDRKTKANDMAFCYTLYRLFAENLAERLRISTEENAQLREALRKYEEKK